MAHQTSDYAGWLLRLTVEYWITIKAKPGKRGTCCSLWLSERWQVREVSGRSIATSSASAHSIEPLEMASSICNFKAPGSVLERCGHVYVCVYLACVRVRACVSHYSFVSPEWVVAIQALCVQSERRREAHLDMRSQIIHLTLRQEGSTERRRAKLKENEEKKGKKGGGEIREGDDERKTNKRVNGVNCKGARGSGLHWRETVMRKSAFVRANGRDGAKKKMRARQRPNAIVLFLSGRRSDFIARSFTMSSWGFSAPVMTIANLCKDMDYTRAKLATKHSIIHILYPAWPHFLENCIDKSLS